MRKGSHSLTQPQMRLIMSKKVKIDLTGTYEDSMDEIDNANIRMNLKFIYEKNTIKFTIILDK